MGKKRTTLKAHLEALHERVAPADVVPAGELAMFGVQMPAELHRLLRRVALARAERGRRRMSVSRVIADLVEQHRAELEKELAR